MRNPESPGFFRALHRKLSDRDQQLVWGLVHTNWGRPRSIMLLPRICRPFRPRILSSRGNTTTSNTLYHPKVRGELPVDVKLKVQMKIDLFWTLSVPIPLNQGRCYQPSWHTCLPPWRRHWTVALRTSSLFTELWVPSLTTRTCNGCLSPRMAC